MSSPLKQNTTTIQELLNTINSLPEAGTQENLDAELATQSNIISEQDAKIAELAEILAGKAGGGSSGNVETIEVEIDSLNWDGIVWYTDTNYQFNSLNINAPETKIINCIKNSPVIFSGYGFLSSIEASFLIGYMEDMNESGMYIYHFTENSTITIRNLETEFI